MKPVAQVHFGFEGIVKRVALIRPPGGQRTIAQMERDGLNPEDYVVRELKAFRNLITNAGLDALGGTTSMQAVGRYCAVGTDNTAPAAGQTALLAQVGTRVDRQQGASINATDVNWESTSPYSYVFWEQRHEFAAGNGTGNLTEVGWFSATSGGTMWSRQLLLDEFSAPTTIVKGASDILLVVYERRMYPGFLDDSYSLLAQDIGGTPTDFDVVARMTSGTSWETSVTMINFGTAAPYTSTNSGRVAESATPVSVGGAVNMTGSSGSALSTSASAAAYTNGNFYRDVTYTFNTGAANFTGNIGSFGWSPVNTNTAVREFTAYFDPPIPKNSTQQLSITIRISWGRV